MNPPFIQEAVKHYCNLHQVYAMVDKYGRRWFVLHPVFKNLPPSYPPQHIVPSEKINYEV